MLFYNLLSNKNVIEISIMNQYKEKSILIISTLVGLVSVLLYVLILEINGFEINDSNLFILIMLPGLLFKLFLFSLSLSLFLTSSLVLFFKHKSKRLIFYASIGLVVTLIIGVPELQKMQSKNLYKITNDMTMDSIQVVDVLEKAITRGDTRSISNIAVHPNMPDSIQEKLTDSDMPEVRRKIAWETNSEKNLIKLSTDPEYEVRMAVATNILTPLKIVCKLQNDTNEYVKNTAFAMYQARN